MPRSAQTYTQKSSITFPAGGCLQTSSVSARNDGAIPCYLSSFRHVITNLDFITSNKIVDNNPINFFFKAQQMLLAAINASLFQLWRKLPWRRPCRHCGSLTQSWVMCADWCQVVRQCDSQSIYGFPARAFQRLQSTQGLLLGVPDSVEISLSQNSHSFKTSSSTHTLVGLTGMHHRYWTFIRWWISIIFAPSLIETDNTDTRTPRHFGACQ